MLDQNTDRMWYVIGAVIIGAAIILIMNTAFPQLFASVGVTFTTKTENTTAVTDGIFPKHRGDGVNLLENPHFAIDGESNRLAMVHGSKAVENSIFTGVVVTGSSQWAKRLEKIVEFDEPGIYTYSIYAKFDTHVDDLVAFTFVNGAPEVNGSYYKEQDGFVVDKKTANSQPIVQKEWATYSVTFSVPEAGKTWIRLYIPFAEPGDSVQVDWEKLEKGTVATPL